ncbi:hypothetical protein HOP50_06g42050 [Chloropicon primus]|uniref:Uncharacterized protein n=1 Tax=Chloropicon primus TaxID=1764295 RepID=A0A7S2WZL5_9CHLO|nr:hypothetical protein HOP50_06g42050 [Chloropicon primus]|mmetsp:Transcript_1689/g.4725  ORF Transcript_1689/g.4725 Transcript_1689/m.4725 type:complete len:232 (+) Transcript_1689:235-930(+)
MGDPREEHLERVLGAERVWGSAGWDGPRSEILERLPVPSRSEVDALLDGFPGILGASEGADGVDLCGVLERVVDHAYSSIAALDGATAADGAGKLGRAEAKDGVPRMIQVYLENESRGNEEAHLCRDQLCTPKTVVDSWRSGNIGASLSLMRRCDGTLGSLLECCLRERTGAAAAQSHAGDGSHCECLISCCQRAPDLAAKVMSSLAHWRRETPSVGLRQACDYICSRVSQ